MAPFENARTRMLTERSVGTCLRMMDDHKYCKLSDACHPTLLTRVSAVKIADPNTNKLESLTSGMASVISTDIQNMLNTNLRHNGLVVVDCVERAWFVWVCRGDGCRGTGA